MRLSKHELLTILAAEVCPVCHGLKHRFNWTCGKCYQPHRASTQHDALNRLCDDHMAAADAFLALARGK